MISKTRIIFVDTYYPKFLKAFWENNRPLSKLSYERQRKKLLEAFFGTSDSFSYNLRKLGFVADDIIANDEILQKQWAVENGLKIRENRIVSRLQTGPYLARLLGKPAWIRKIALEQIKKYKPDIVYMQNLEILDVDTLTEVKKQCRLLVGQIASPLPDKKYLKKYDLIVSSFPHYVKKFRRMGIKSEYQKLAFDPRILKAVDKQKKKYGATFIGSFTPYHVAGTRMLEKAAKNIPIHVWGQGIEFLSPFSPLRKNYHGEAWGLGMYKILAQSKIVINRHIGVAGDYANNMRLFEATGCGAMLITDRKKNLGDLFREGREAVSYKTSQDLIEKLNYFLENDQERMKIAMAGQKRTLKNHSYPVRMKELTKIVYKYL